MAYRSSTTEVSRGGDRWDRDRFAYERDRYDERDRFEERDRFYERDGRRVRESSFDRFERRSSRPADDDYVRDRRVYEDDARYRRDPPADYERRVFVEKEREREYRSPSPVRRPTMLRRQSSLDTFDRRPRFMDRDREEYGPPARREDYRPEPYVPIAVPLPRSRALPPPRMYAERDYDEIRIQEPERYGNEDFHTYPERVREREVIRERNHRDTSRARSHRASTVRSSSRSSTTTSSSSSSSRTTTTAKSEYPKKGKTRIPVRLVSRRALIDLGYPFEEEGNTLIVQKALGQDNIDDLLKLSEDYKKAELEVAAARSAPGNVIEERRTEVFTIPPPPLPSAPAPPPAPPPAEIINTTTVVRDVSPSRSTTSYTTSTTGRTPVVVEARPREVSTEIAVGPLALVSQGRGGRDIAAEIARLEAERDLIRYGHHHHHHHDHHSNSPHRELVRAERLESGELVLYEEQVEKVTEPKRGVRIEKDKRGRMSISVPKRK